ncbi:hypothetical protein DN730_06475 [Marinomonas piezotolerans]|uniref:DUF4870 domain-containing protein n=1 Tax=Marinomonas piezotolerans TaxID=2213058 RepID=A0A370UBT2_9GAMM|nr:hypothetical protein [Marinomonas piezotolerans]RDL45252.1 hypothetical protein DN730_06475 [Marinomonas piezotolerans]
MMMTERDEQAKTHALIAYLMMVFGLFTGIFWLIGAVWAMAKARDAKDTLFEDHYNNMISIFWWGIGLSIIGVVLAAFVIGYFLLLGVWIWSIVKLFKGLAKVTSNQPYRSF